MLLILIVLVIFGLFILGKIRAWVDETNAYWKMITVILNRNRISEEEK